METKGKRTCRKKIAFVCLLALLAFFCVLVCGLSPMRSVAEDEVFTVTGENGETATVTAGADMFSDNTTYKFNVPPANLTGIGYVKSPKAGDTYTVTSGEGWVYVLTMIVTDTQYAGTVVPDGIVAQGQNLLQDGFELQEFTFYTSFCEAHANPNNNNYYANYPIEVYKKYMRKGAKFTLQNTTVVLFSKEAVNFEVAVPQDASNAVDTVRGGS